MRRSQREGWRRRDAGASAVEMAIVLPVLAFLVFGIIDFGRALNAEIELSQAAREGVRLAALSGSGGYSSADVAARVSLAGPNPGFQGGGASLAAAPVLCPSPPSTATPVATVTAQYQFRGIFYFTGGVPLRQVAVMRCGG